MILTPPRSTRTDPLLPYTTLLRSALLNLPVDTIGSRFPDIPAGLPVPSFPDISVAKINAVLPSAFTIAFLAGIEALLSAVVADGMAGTRHRSNQELIGQGVANLGSALRSEEHTSELQSLMRISYAVFCLKKKKNIKIT